MEEKIQEYSNLRWRSGPCTQCHTVSNAYRSLQLFSRTMYIIVFFTFSLYNQTAHVAIYCAVMFEKAMFWNLEANWKYACTLHLAIQSVTWFIYWTGKHSELLLNCFPEITYSSVALVLEVLTNYYANALHLMTIFSDRKYCTVT